MHSSSPHACYVTLHIIRLDLIILRIFGEEYKLWSYEVSDVIVAETELNTTYRKYKESALMSLVAHLISQPSSDISATWNPTVAAEIRKLQLRPV
jgi:hypothetical protein